MFIAVELAIHEHLRASSSYSILAAIRWRWKHQIQGTWLCHLWRWETELVPDTLRNSGSYSKFSSLAVSLAYNTCIISKRWSVTFLKLTHHSRNFNQPEMVCIERSISRVTSYSAYLSKRYACKVRSHSVTIILPNLSLCRHSMLVLYL